MDTSVLYPHVNPCTLLIVDIFISSVRGNVQTGKFTFSKRERCSSTKTFAISVEKERSGDKRKSKESQQGIAPTVVQSVVHAWPRQRQKGTENVTQEIIGTERRGSSLGTKNVDQIELRGHLCGLEGCNV